MKVTYYNPVDEKGGCIVRSISKALNKDYLDIKNDLININNNYKNEKVFEEYLFKNNFIINNNYNNKLIKDISLEGLNIVLAYKDDWYHMMCVIDNTIYDKKNYDDIKDLRIIKIYKKI